MKKLLLATVTAVAMIGTAHAGTDTLTYLCRDHHKTYPVTVTNNGCDETAGSSSCTITWRGKIYRNVKVGDEPCKEEFVGPGIELCAKTQGFASLKVGDVMFDC
jgi:hypothetical protein